MSLAPSLSPFPLSSCDLDTGEGVILLVFVFVCVCVCECVCVWVCAVGVNRYRINRSDKVPSVCDLILCNMLVGVGNNS